MLCGLADLDEAETHSSLVNIILLVFSLVALYRLGNLMKLGSDEVLSILYSFCIFRLDASGIDPR